MEWYVMLCYVHLCYVIQYMEFSPKYWWWTLYVDGNYHPQLSPHEYPKSQKAPSRRQVIRCWHPRGRLARPSATPFDCPSAMKSTERRHEEPWVKRSYLTWLNHRNTFQMLSFWWFLIFKIVFFRLFRRTCGCRQQNWTTTVGFETGFVIGLWAKVGLQQYVCGRWDVHPQIRTPWLCVGRWISIFQHHDA